MGSFDWFPNSFKPRDILRAGIPFNSEKRSIVKNTWDYGIPNPGGPESDEFYAAKKLEARKKKNLSPAGRMFKPRTI